MKAVVASESGQENQSKEQREHKYPNQSDCNQLVSVAEYRTLAGRFQDLDVESCSGEIAFCNFEAPSGVTFCHSNLPIRFFATFLGIPPNQCLQFEQNSPLRGPLSRLLTAELALGWHFLKLSQIRAAYRPPKYVLGHLR